LKAPYKGYEYQIHTLKMPYITKKIMIMMSGEVHRSLVHRRYRGKRLKENNNMLIC